MTRPDYDYLFKLLMVGDSGVGKTSLLLRFHSGEFKESLRNTVGVDLKVKMVNFGKHRLKLTIWDTAGQERFRTLTSAYYRGAHGVILAYDITNRESFENVQEWLKEVDTFSTNKDVVKLLVGNKIDRESEREVKKEEGAAFARQNGMLFIEASAKEQTGVQQTFEELIQKILDVPALLEGDSRPSGGGAGGGSGSGSGSVKVDYSDNEGGGQGGGCGGWCGGS